MREEQLKSDHEMILQLLTTIRTNCHTNRGG